MNTIEFKCIVEDDDKVFLTINDNHYEPFCENETTYIETTSNQGDIRLSKKNSLKLATSIIDEYCDTEKKSKKQLKSEIAKLQMRIAELEKDKRNATEHLNKSIKVKTVETAFESLEQENETLKTAFVGLFNEVAARFDTELKDFTNATSGLKKVLNKSRDVLNGYGDLKVPITENPQNKDNDNDFYMCYVDGGNAPKYIHDTHDKAVTEAKRLCESLGKWSYVLKAVNAYRPETKRTAVENIVLNPNTDLPF